MKRAIPILTALALALAACGSDDDASGSAAGSSDASSAGVTESVTADGATSASVDSTTASGTSVSSTSAEAQAFPVTIEHKYGETTIGSEPIRVVSVGFTDQDFLLALGVVPVGIREWYGEQPSATWPWATDELGGATPAVLSATEINFEQVAALDPDLIVGVSSGMTDTEYETLSQIAPTLTQTADYIDYGTPWDVTTELIGKAVGRSAQAEQVVADVEAKFAAARQSNPDFEGATAAVGFYFEEMPGAYASPDSRSQVMIDLGFVIPPEFDELAGDAFYFSVSSEDVDVLDTDVLVWIVGSDAELPTIASMAVRPGLTAYAEGREVFTSSLLAGAFSFASPLSIDYLLEQLVPELALAVDGDPATVVPSSAGMIGVARSGGSSDDPSTSAGA